MSSDSEPDEVPDKNGDDDGSGMSAYERQRQENIARNQAVLASLGLAGGSGLIRPSASSVSDRPPRQPRQPREKVVYERREMPRAHGLLFTHTRRGADESRSFAGQSSSQCPCRIREDYRTNIFVGRTLYLYRISYILYVPAVGGGAGTDRHE